MTAIRETFEETGLLFASPTSKPFPSDAILDASRESIYTGNSLFPDFLNHHALSADPKALLPFSEWISPLVNPRCVHTTFARALWPRALSHPTYIYNKLIMNHLF
jgi:8-oxo-dGTP pyrophosphatase MutT (NUDIX family)